MLLQRLTEFQRPMISGVDDLPPFYQSRPMRWGLMIDADGQLAMPDLLDLSDPTDKLRRFGEPGPVPYLTRSSGASPLLGADDIQYVLGWADDDAKPDWVGRCHASFVDLVHRWATAFPADLIAQAVDGFFTRRGHNQVRRPEVWTSKQGIVLLVGDDGHWLPEERSVQIFWEREVQRRKAGGDSPDGGRRGVCLVCGQDGVLVERFPQGIPRRLVPLAGQAIAALVSANKKIHTYDFSDSLATVPICIGCARISVANLHYLLDHPDHSLSGSDGRMTWWTIGREVAVMTLMGQARAADVRVLGERVHSGRGTEDTDLEHERFCSVTISGSGARIAVRDWIDMPLAQLEENIIHWFGDHQTYGVNLARGGYVPLTRLVLATGRWIEQGGGDRSSGEYARFDDRSAQRPDGVRRDLLRIALKNLPVPPALFGHLLTRIRTDGHVDDARVALLRLALVRRARLADERNRPVPGPGLDPDNHDPAYLAGRIFAQLESIQYYASQMGREKGDRLNTTFADRYFAGAVANPKTALIQGWLLVHPWLKKIRRDSIARAVALENQLHGLNELLVASGGFPGRGNPDDQAMFILGYSHHRSDSMRRGGAANAAKTPGPGFPPNTPGMPADPGTPTP
ncbi:hypothetical protein ThrDRAFT_03247 [Frankia casuarinae]|uniref:CRISPR-associated protein, Csd1 family n=1 Tax=Frankia casuarinae (strain DSM 45818 / CECT 9043 / HFP020203 / CcI3) TaxID=106370 RepID=Q2J7P2_FRACC|nr:type I-C CRISPR-associated protein Cas8c/Csd1 [Frankia casuarinae]ABD12700.1 CRISPR-associated protein, Csd1 family [Frankia casuarinae]EYT91145.1 hypothetical protein ThrDRAFT_03247 [Frankia casuarinae]